MKLSDRLQVIADNIGACETVADIGTDHGYLPIYLLEKNPNRKIILTDISNGSLEKGRENAKRFHCEEYLDFRLGDGITVLDNGEVDTIVIAGMGGMLIGDILSLDIAKTKSFLTYILEPRKNPGIPRRVLLNLGFRQVDSSLVREGDYIWEIQTFVTGGEGTTVSIPKDAIDADYDFPKELVTEFRNELTDEYLRYHLAKEKKMLDNMRLSVSIEPAEITHQEQRVKHLEGLINYETERNY